MLLRVFEISFEVDKVVLENLHADFKRRIGKSEGRILTANSPC